jgi:hypothetical protein
MAEQLIDRAIADLADRTSVDWDALDREAGSGDTRDWVDCLRILGGIADLHGTSGEEDGQPGPGRRASAFPGVSRTASRRRCHMP